MRNRLWFFRIIPWNRPDDPRYSFCLCPRLYVGCICPFFQTAIFPVVFFPPGESLFFFGWIDTWKFPPTPRRGIINYRVAARNAPDPLLPSVFSISLLFFPLPDLEFRGMYIRTAVAIVAFRALDCSTRNAAVCMVSPGVVSRRTASMGRGLQNYIDVEALRRTAHTRRPSCATVWNYFCQIETRDRIELSLTRKAVSDKSESMFLAWIHLGNWKKQNKYYETFVLVVVIIRIRILIWYLFIECNNRLRYHIVNCFSSFSLFRLKWNINNTLLIKRDYNFRAPTTICFTN